MLGVRDFELSLTYPEKYFKSLTCEDNGHLEFKRVKSCCPFRTVNSDKLKYKNLAVLEVFSVRCQSMTSPVYLYINFFDQGKVLAPKGFSYKRL
jgi:hypothetical protein